MTHTKIFSIAFALLLLLLFLPGSIRAQEQTEEAVDPQVELVKAIIKQVRTDIRQFKESKGKEDDPQHPARRWAPVLWQYYQAHPDSDDGTRAASEALHLFAQTGNQEETLSRARSIPSQDRAWKNITSDLYFSLRGKRLASFIDLSQSVFSETTDTEVRAAVGRVLAEAYMTDGANQKARAVFEKILEDSPESDMAKLARGFLHELDNLNAGQPAPVFEAQTTNGTAIDLKELKGKVVLLDFWASWCEPCIPEIPRLKKFYKKYSKKGLVILGISADTNRQALDEMVADKKIPWLQVYDDKGVEAPVMRLYNIMGIPAYYLVDREGVILARSDYTRRGEPNLRDKKILENLIKKALKN